MSNSNVLQKSQSTDAKLIQEITSPMKIEDLAKQEVQNSIREYNQEQTKRGLEDFFVRYMRRIQSRQVLKQKEFNTRFPDRNLKKSQSQPDLKGGSQSPKNLRNDQLIDKDYENALKRLLLSDKNEEKKRINILEQKAGVMTQEKNKALGEGKEQEAKKQNEIKLVDSEDSDNNKDDDEDKILNEEERSLIVEEILRANGDLVLEETSPRDEVPTGLMRMLSKLGEALEAKTKAMSQPKKKLKIIVKSDKEPRLKTKNSLSESQKIQQLNLLMSKHRNDKTVFETGFLSAHKMQIVKQSKKERQGPKYALMKELMRDKVTITAVDNGFQIIIPKSLQYGKANLRQMDMDEFVKNYYVFRINQKDILKLIKQQLNLDTTENEQVLITKEQVSLFLKKNLNKLLVAEDPDKLKKDKKMQEQLQKLEDIKHRKLHREKEKILRQLQKEEELQEKRERAMFERLSQQDHKKSKEAFVEEQRRRMNQQRQSLFKVVTETDSNVQTTSDRPDIYGQRNSFTNMGQNMSDLQMVYATELKIAERREDIRKRLELLKMEKDQERLRNERYQMYNFIRDVIVRGMIINRGVGAYIRAKDQGQLNQYEIMLRTFSYPEETKEPQHRLSIVGQIAGYGSFQYDKQIRLQTYKAMQAPKLKKNSSKQATSGDNITLGRLDGGDNTDSQSQRGHQRRVQRKSQHHPTESINSYSDMPFDDEKKPFMRRSRRKSVEESKQEKSIDDEQPPKIEINGQHHLKITHQPSTSSRKGSRSYNDVRRSSNNSQRKSSVNNYNQNREDKSTPIIKTDKRVSEEYIREFGDESIGSRTHVIQKSIINSRAGNRSPQNKANTEDSIEEYYEDVGPDPDDLHELRDQIGKVPATQGQIGSTKVGKRVRRIRLISESNKIKDYNLDIQSSSSQDVNIQSNTNLPVMSQSNMGGPGGDIYSVLDSDMAEDEMTKEEEIQRINQELQYQRILEKITEKMMSRKISPFKKELLIRIALNLEMMATEDLGTLEELLERFESHDADVKKMIVELFQEKYQIDLGTSLQVMVEEQMNKVKDESRAMKRKNIKDLLLKKIRMLNLISRFCKPGQPIDPFLAAQKAQARLKDLLDADDEEFYSDDEEGNLKQLFQETVNEVLKRIFSPEEAVITKQLQNFKKAFKAKFSAQPEYLIKDDLESEEQHTKEMMSNFRIRSFVFNEARLLEVLNNWLHPESFVKEGKLGESIETKQARRRNFLYDINAEINEDNLFELMYDLVQELMVRLKVVQQCIKHNRKLLGYRGEYKDGKGVIRQPHLEESIGDDEEIEISENGSIRKKRKAEPLNARIDLEALNQRRQVSDIELKERQYCALRIAEHIEQNMLQMHEESRLKQEDLNDPEKEYQKKIYLKNFLDPEIPERILQRDTIAHWRESKPDYFDPLLRVMAHAFKHYAQMKKE